MANKLIGKERREAISNWLKNEGQPIKGSELAKRAGVSRQVIVQDISLLKAQNYAIMATSQGYMLLNTNEQESKAKRIVACKHNPEDTQAELEAIVDQGVTVKNVMVEHPIYGEIEASVMVSDRHDVHNFIQNVESKNAPYLLELTEGTHLHTLEAENEDKLDAAEAALKELGFLLN
ncbi:hypothetical protein SAMN05421734_103163 [Pelagirhabdus alkalitolerans]|uniref:Transcriptional regulator n=1 Tax=Pelagirhabdus alkalitolerans TaxID=1612202 RepID=A0A1G6HQ50_9BACI|nr:transcription repressor NadR [Pelagirhabdus alkalitolerans]SDB96273.1 hypothetical protein SAMN05421734_103163 [Pelagirhabdus alkalitolerans]